MRASPKNRYLGTQLLRPDGPGGVLRSVNVLRKELSPYVAVLGEDADIARLWFAWSS